MGEALILILGTIVTIFMGYTAFASDRDSTSNRIFLSLTITISFWSLISYLSTTSNSGNIYLIRLVMFLVVVMNTLYGILIRHFPEANFATIFKKERYYIYFTILVLIVTLSPYLFTKLENNNGTTTPLAGPGMLFFVLHVLYFVVLSSVVLIRRVKQSSGTMRPQLVFLSLGAIILFIVTPVLNFVLPITISNSIGVRYSPLIMAVFASIIFYSMVKHRLFNLRSAAARTSSYFIVITTITLLSASFAYIFRFLLIPGLKVDKTQIIANATVATLIAISYPYVKRVFDSITNKIFFRYSYDPQSVIDRLNKSLLMNMNLDELLTKSALIIQEEFKASFCTFFIRETSYFDERIIGAHRRQPEIDDYDEIKKLITKLKIKVFSRTNDLTSDDEKSLAKLLKNNEVEVIARLANNVDYNILGIGFLVLGSKKSGGVYTSQDLKLIEIIANELVIAVENILRFEEIEEFNVTLQKKIDEATKELKRSNDKLLALDEAKDEFVSMASHQLRTPLTSVKGYISMVLEGDAGNINETQKQMLGQALFSSQRMVYLISDLLNVSRLKTGKFAIEPKPVYLPDVIESEVAQLYEGVNSKGLTLVYDKPKSFPTMNLDDMKIRQVIMNFMDNAIYYTPNGGKITVALKENKESIEFTVKDSGIGVPKKEQHKLFAKFYRAENARKARPDGTGLGLFMAKKVVIAQGGSIIFDSKEGKGSTFGFSFPREKLEVKQQQKPD